MNAKDLAEQKARNQAWFDFQRPPDNQGNQKVKPMMNTNRMPGPGDEATWGPCTGHPLDPRTPDPADLSDLIKAEEEAILFDHEVMADVLYAADQGELMDLSAVLCDLVTSTVPNWDIQHAGAIRTAVKEFVHHAAKEVVAYEEAMK